MPLHITIPHHLSQAEALKRTKTLLANVKKQHEKEISGLSEIWEDNKGTFEFTVRGYKISGTIVVDTSHIFINGDIPWTLSIFKGVIEKTMRQYANDALSK